MAISITSILMILLYLVIIGVVAGALMRIKMLEAVREFIPIVAVLLCILLIISMVSGGPVFVR